MAAKGASLTEGMRPMIYTLAQLRDGTGFPTDARFEQVEDYNGWTNRETWAVALYINNDQGRQEAVFEALTAAHLEQRGSVLEGATEDDHQRVREHMAGEIIKENVETLLDPQAYRDEFGDQQPEALAIALYDIGSLYRVNWDELGASFLEDVKD